MLDVLHRYAHGYVLLPVLDVFYKRNVFDYLLEHGDDNITTIAESLGANIGHFHVAMRMFESLGWLNIAESQRVYVKQIKKPIILDELFFFYHTDIFNAIFMPEALPVLQAWLSYSFRNIDDYSSQMCDILDGPFAVAILLSFSRQKLNWSSFVSTKNPEIVQVVRSFFAHKGWVKNEELTPLGTYVLERSLILAVPASYRMMLRNMDSLLWGDPKTILMCDKNGHEQHVDRALNVEASGFQHQRFFDHVDKIIGDIFNQESLQAQPKYIVDMGCGDGTLLKRVYERIKIHTHRGMHLDTHPLYMIGVDLYQKSLDITAQTLRNIPHLLLLGDVSKPEQLIQLLSQQGIDDPENCLHIRSFLDHELLYQELNTQEPSHRIDLKSHAIYVGPQGQLIDAGRMMQHFLAHFKRWASISTRHGFIILDVHSSSSKVLQNYIDECGDAHFDALQSFSGQNLLPASIYLALMAEAGLFPESAYFKCFPNTLPLTRITLNWFKQQPYMIRTACDEDILSLLDIEQACWLEALQMSIADIKLQISRGMTYVLVYQENIVGVVYTQRIAHRDLLLSTSYSEIKKLHHHENTVLQLLGINVLPIYQTLGFGDVLLGFILRQAMVTSDIQSVVGVTRCTNYKKYDQHISYEDYVLKDCNRSFPLDPTLLFHVSHGANIVELISAYRPEDLENQSYGILIEYECLAAHTLSPLLSPRDSSESDESVIQCVVTEIILRQLKMCEANREYQPDVAFRDLGFDSLDLMELRYALNQRLNLAIESTIFFQYAQPSALITYIQSQVGSSIDKTSPCQSSGSSPIQNSLKLECDDIAVIGMSCKFPGQVNSLHDYWRLLSLGQSGISSLSKEREAIWLESAMFDSAHPAFKYAGFIDAPDQFDAKFFGLSPREAAHMDPQHRLLMELHWLALLQAGIHPSTLKRSHTGVYVGIASHDYEILKLKTSNILNEPAYFALGSSESIAAGRISYFFDFIGPALSVNTACSSSLVAIHLACQSLKQNEVSLALASGVNLMLSPIMTQSYLATNMLSKTSESRIFDARASGYVRGEGAGVVVLKRLREAIADSDPILAIIRGSHVNQDGASNGLTAPNQNSQELLLKQALDKANCSPESVGYIEAHGTGTILGDPIELAAINAIYGPSRTAENPLYIGSVKSNLGHLEAAAGIAGLLKTVLMLQHKRIAKNIHFEQLNQNMKFNQDCISIANKDTPWSTSDGRARLAGVSAFGMSGTNAHVIVEEAPRDTVTRHIEMPWPVFQRERHWYSDVLKLHDTPSKPISPNVSSSVSDEESCKEKTFQCELSLSRAPYLADHLVNGSIVFPATGYLAFLFEMLANEKIEAELLSIQFKRPLVLVDKCTYFLRVVWYTEQQISIDVSIDNKHWISYVQAVISVLSKKINKHLDIKSYVKPTIHQRLDYLSFGRIGIKHGPMFQCVREIYHCSQGIFAKIFLEHQDLVYGVHPALLDGCLQATGVLWLHKQTLLCLPVSMHRVVIQGVLPETIWVHMDEARFRSEGGCYFVSFDLYNELGAWVGCIEDLCFQTIEPETWARTILQVSSIHSNVHVNEQSEYVWLKLQTLSPEGAHELLEEHLAAIISTVLRYPSHQSVDRNKGFFDLGMDSIMSVEFGQEIESLLQRKVCIKTQSLFDYPTISMLAVYVLSLCRPDVVVPSPVVVQSQDKIVSDDIAIISIGCRFPGDIDSPEAYWNLLQEGRDAITTLPTDRMFQNDTPIQQGGFLRYIDYFDADFFEISPKEANYLDPQQRLVLEVSEELLRRAGLNRAQVRHTRTGVFIGVSANDYAKLIRETIEKSQTELYSLVGNSGATASGRISFYYGFQGPSITVDTACSSSLVSIHLACQSLRQRESDMALAGGVNVMLDTGTTHAFYTGGMLSPDARCKTFDASANGYVRSEGCGLVLLKRLDDARRDGDPILAVIKGSAVNQDGASSGLTVPSGQSQVQVMEAALRQASVQGHSVSFIETHGTGTSLGDPIEVNAITQVYGKPDARLSPLYLGAVKTQLGHLEAAAGVASLLKVVLMLQHQCRVKNLHFHSLNSQITLDPEIIRPIEVTESWDIDGEECRTAGVSAFSFCGTNAHVILAEAPHDAISRTPEIILPNFQRKRYWIDKIQKPSNTAPSYTTVSLLEQLPLHQIFLQSFATVVDEMQPVFHSWVIFYSIQAFKCLGTAFFVGEKIIWESWISRSNIAPRHLRLVGHFIKLWVEAGILCHEETGWTVVSDVQAPSLSIEDAVSQYPDYRIALTLFSRCVANLVDALQGRVDVLELLFTGDVSAATFYLESPEYIAVNTHLSREFERFLAQYPKNRPLRILELGAGYGGTTKHILPLLQKFSHRVEYIYSDVTPIFFEHARSLFAAYPFVQYRLFNLENSLESNGFLSNSFDIIVAANVLHATRSLPNSINCVKSLLVQGGYLWLLEGTEANPFIDLTFGLLEGWWLFDDMYRQNYPLLLLQKWLKLLDVHGFQARVIQEQYALQSIVLCQLTHDVNLERQMPDDVCLAQCSSQRDYGAKKETNRLPPQIDIDSNLLITLQQMTSLEAEHYLELYLAQLLASILQREDTDLIPRDKGFFELGMDSLMAVTFSKRIENSLNGQISIKSQSVFDYPSLSRLVTYVLSKLQLWPERKLYSSQKPSPVDCSDGIAIISMDCRFPGGCDSPEAYWRFLYAGEDGVMDVPTDRWPKDEAFVKRGGFIDRVGYFDANFFEISPKEAKALDPQQRVLLEIAETMLRRAGLTRAGVKYSNTGVFIGLSSNDYGRLLCEATEKSQTDLYYPLGNSSATISGRLSFYYGLEGPSLTIDTACSSSLVGVHLACQSLKQGECDMALAGGINLMLDVRITHSLYAGGMLSPDGYCKTFDANANGFARGEGGGLVLLKRLADAKRDGDKILAIIRGSAVNQDGASSGFTTPRGPSQVQVMEAALRQASLLSQEISFVETHGTGTPLGDPIEVNAIVQTYGQGREISTPLYLGAVKTQLGHLEAAAGIAGLIKVILMLQHQTRVKNLHFTQLNPEITLDDVHIKLTDTVEPWHVKPEQSRIAGVSAFGFSGTNAHVILEEAPIDLIERDMAISLPLFQREYYWFDSSKELKVSLGSSLAYAFLRSKLNSPTRDKVFQGELSLSSKAYLSDHKVRGHVVFPATGYLELFFEVLATEQAIGSLTSVQLERGLLLSEEQRCTIQVIWRDDQNLSIYSSLDGKQWVLHAKATFTPGAAEPAQEKYFNIEEWTSQTKAQRLDFSAFHRMGIEHGPQFQGVKGVYHRPQGFLAEIEVVFGTDYIAHPVLLDSCFQVIGELFQGYDQLYLPVSMQQVQIFKRLPSQLWVYIDFNDVRSSGGHHFVTLTLYDAQGVYVGRVEELCFQMVSADAWASLSGQLKSYEACYYELYWQSYGSVATLLAQDILRYKGSRCVLFHRTPMLAKALKNIALKNDIFLIDVSLQDINIQMVDPHWMKVDHVIYTSLYDIIVPEDVPDLAMETSLSFLDITQIFIKYYTENNISSWPTITLVTGQSLIDQTLWGMGRSLQNEYLNWPIRLITCEPNAPHALAEGIFAILLHASQEHQFRLKQVDIEVCRLRTCENLEKERSILNQQMSEKNYRYLAGTTGLLDEVVFERVAVAAVNSKQVRVVVKAVSLNFKDVLIAMQLLDSSQKFLGGDFSGEVIDVGEEVVDFCVGDRVFGVAQGALASEVIVDVTQIQRIPEMWSFEEASTLPWAYMTALYTLDDLAKMKPGDSVLIHVATGGVGLAAVAYAQRKGAIIYATAGSEEKRNYLRQIGIQYVYDSRTTDFSEAILRDTQGNGVHIVLNSLTSEGWIEASLACCAQEACFIEIGKLGIWSPDEVQAFRPDVIYHAVALDEIFSMPSENGAVLLQRVVDLKTAPLPMTIYPRYQYVQAFQHLQQAKHIGKIVIREATLLDHANGVYIITGGLSGIGEAVCHWLVEQGIKNIAILARREATNEQREHFQRWSYADINVCSYAVDISDQEALKIVFNRIQLEQGNISSIIHSAGVLADASILNQSKENFQKVYASKVYGAWFLHELTKHEPSIQFVVFSSMAGFVGAPGQSNYAAANVFLDELMAYRRTKGLRGISIAWGAWGEVGLLLSQPSSMQAWASRSLTTQEGLSVLGHVLSRQQDVERIGVMVMDWEGYVSSLDHIPPLLRDLVQLPQIKNSINWLAELAQLSAQDAVLHLEEQLTSILSAVLHYHEQQKIPRDKGFFELGLDSITTVEFEQRLTRLFKRSMPITAKTFLEYPTLRDLTLYLWQDIQSYVEAALSESSETMEKAVQTSIESKETKRFPLTKQQLSLYFLSTVNKTLHLSYNKQTILHFDRPCDIEKLKFALYLLTQRHAALRLNIIEIQGDLFQNVSFSAMMPIRLSDGSLKEEAMQDRLIAFDLHQAPLARALIVKDGLDLYSVVLTFHHLIIDAWSLVILANEYRIIYSALEIGEEPPLTHNAYSYVDYSNEQYQRDLQFSSSTSLTFWKNYLNGYEPSVFIQQYCQFSAEPQIAGYHVRIFSVEEKELIIQCAQRYNVTVFVLIVALLVFLLSSFSSQMDIVVGSVLSQRNKEEYQHLVGYLAKTICYRFQVDLDVSFEQYLYDVFTSILDAQAHAELPFTEIVNLFQDEHTRHSEFPIFQVLINEIHLPNIAMDLNQLAVPENYPHFPLNIQLLVTDEQLGLWFEFDRNLNEMGIMDQFVKSFDVLFVQLMQKGIRLLGEYDILQPENDERDCVIDTSSEVLV